MPLTMTKPTLLPRARSPVTSVMPGPQLVPTHSDWAATYSELERLYVRERRKLRYIMQYMEREHGFKATQQMYKKRFAKWDFQKNSRRPAASVPILTTKNECKGVLSNYLDPSEELELLPPTPGLGHHESLVLMVLTSARICSVAFFESLQSCDGFLASPQQPLPTDQPLPEQAQEASFTFKLVIDLLDRGQGELAGRMARKAFLLVEDTLMLEAPALVWNLLEMMHHMVKLRHARLFQVLLAHLIALCDRRKPKAHPLPAMLRGLRGLVASLTSVASSPESSEATSSSFSSAAFTPLPSTDEDGKTTAASPWLPYYGVAALLEQAWVLNAEILFNHFDSRLILLYSRVHWDSCSIGPPAAIVSAANQWFSQIESQQIPSAMVEALRAMDFSEITAVEEDTMVRHLLAPRTDASPPRDYEMLRASSVAALREHGDSIFSKGIGHIGDTTILLRILAGVVTAKFFEDSHTILERSGTAHKMTKNVSRGHASHLACAIKTLMHLNRDHIGKGLVGSWDAVERIRSIVALREYARGEADPQVVRDLWQLEDALVAAGEYGEALEVRQQALRRLEKYTQDIPVDFA